MGVTTNQILSLSVCARRWIAGAGRSVCSRIAPLTGESTIFRLLRGQYSRKTLVKVQRALDLEDVSPPKRQAFASTELGGYVREIFAHYEGDFRLVRTTFEESEDVMVYPMRIYWSDDEPGLVFEDSNPGYEQSGNIMVPAGTPFVHFVTYDRGSARLNHGLSYASRTKVPAWGHYDDCQSSGARTLSCRRPGCDRQSQAE